MRVGIGVMSTMWSEMLTLAERYGRDRGAPRLMLRSAPQMSDVKFVDTAMELAAGVPVPAEA